MPTRLLLDGEDLPALMLRVRQEMGPDARIVKAERIRSGGIAGFFARERFELTVEVPEPARRTLPRGRGTAPAVRPDDVAGIDALLAAADAAEAGLSDDAAGAQDAGESADGGAAPGEPADGDASEPAPPAVSTSGETFAEVLASMRQLVGAPAEPAAEPATEPAADVAAKSSAQAPAQLEAVPANDDVPALPAAEAPEGPAPSPDEQGPPTAQDPPAEQDPPADPVVENRSGSNVTALLELGIPTRLLAGFSDPHAAVPLSVLVRRFEPPPSPRLRPGTVVGIVGGPDAALRTATQMAHRAGLDPHDIVLAGDIAPVAGHGRRLQTPSAVARHRERVSRDVLTLVVIGVGPERQDQDAAAALLEALAPDQAWAVLDARRKGAELRRWLRAVGARRRFDAVAATSTFDAQAPGTVLTLGTPVGWVDGLPASPIVWAAVLSERLADDARWD